MNSAAERNLIDKESRRDLVSNQLVLVVPKTHPVEIAANPTSIYRVCWVRRDAWQLAIPHMYPRDVTPGVCGENISGALPGAGGGVLEPEA